MRKQTKLVAVLSAAALLAIGASMTSMATQGWQQEGEDWYYYDNNGDYVTNDWRKSGNNWYYLGDDGYMMKNYLLEDGDNIYYLDGNGVMVTNAWVAYTPEDDYEEDAPDHYWYYFQANGRAVKASDGLKKKDINGKTYGFDEDGVMVSGWDDQKSSASVKSTDSKYFNGDTEGWMARKGWIRAVPAESINKEDYDDDTNRWFYAGANGKIFGTIQLRY